LIEQRKQQRVQDKLQKEMEAAARKLSIQKAKEAKKVYQQIQNDFILASKDKKQKKKQSTGTKRDYFGGYS
jgi:hypothetical protein